MLKTSIIDESTFEIAGVVYKVGQALTLTDNEREKIDAIIDIDKECTLLKCDVARGALLGHAVDMTHRMGMIHLLLRDRQAKILECAASVALRLGGNLPLTLDLAKKEAVVVKCPPNYPLNWTPQTVVEANGFMPIVAARDLITVFSTHDEWSLASIDMTSVAGVVAIKIPTNSRCTPNWEKLGPAMQATKGWVYTLTEMTAMESQQILKGSSAPLDKIIAGLPAIGLFKIQKLHIVAPTAPEASDYCCYSVGMLGDKVVITAEKLVKAADGNLVGEKWDNAILPEYVSKQIPTNYFGPNLFIPELAPIAEKTTS